MAEQESPDLLKMQVAKRTYALSVNRRFAYVKRYNVMKRTQEVQENPLFRKIRLTIYKLIGRKER